MIKLFKQKSLLLLVVVMFLAGVISGCSSNEESVVDDAYDTTVREKDEEEVEEEVEENLDHPMVQIEMMDGGIMVFELYPEYAPETVANFVSLAKAGFYDGLTFHRIVKGFMVQGGDPSGDGTGGSEQTITGEFSSNDFEQNTLKHTRGVISMARSYNPNSASSQFFIMDGDIESLNGEYAAFGKMTEGDETLTAIAETEVEPNPNTGEVSIPVTDVVIKTVTVLE